MGTSSNMGSLHSHTTFCSSYGIPNRSGRGIWDFVEGDTLVDITEVRIWPSSDGASRSGIWLHMILDTFTRLLTLTCCSWRERPTRKITVEIKNIRERGERPMLRLVLVCGLCRWTNDHPFYESLWHKNTSYVGQVIA
jgi:hypothetical protein